MPDGSNMSGQPFYAALKAALAADLRPTEKLVLISILEKANDATANCMHSNETIAAGLGIKRQQVDRAVKELIAKGFIERPERTRQSWHKLVRMQQLVAATNSCIEGNKKLHDTQQIVASDATNSCTNVLSSLNTSISSLADSPRKQPQTNDNHAATPPPVRVVPPLPPLPVAASPAPPPKPHKATPKGGLEPPSLEACLAYRHDIQMSKAETERFFKYYQEANWHTATGRKITNWKISMQSWRATWARQHPDEVKKYHEAMANNARVEKALKEDMEWLLSTGLTYEQIVNP